jgi:hypothetical protein
MRRVIKTINRALGTLTFCPTGKIAYHDRAHAERAARRLLRVGYYRPYPCSECGWWHLTSRPYNQRRPHA